MNDLSSAKKYAKKFGCPDRTYALLVADTYARKEMWTEFESLISTSNNVLNDEDIAEICFKYSNQMLGMNYLNNLPPDSKQYIVSKFKLSG